MYLGRSPSIGSQKLLDSIESQFNGTLDTFDLRYGGNPTYPTLSASLIVSLGGVLQEPGQAYDVSSDKIIFSEPPPAGTDCWMLLYNQYGTTEVSAHSQLTGLANDDHTQYLHKTISRDGIGASIHTTGMISAAIISNPQTITADQSIPPDHNANSWGPIDIANGITVEVGLGSVWTVR